MANDDFSQRLRASAALLNNAADEIDDLGARLHESEATTQSVQADLDELKAENLIVGSEISSLDVDDLRRKTHYVGKENDRLVFKNTFLYEKNQSLEKRVAEAETNNKELNELLADYKQRHHDEELKCTSLDEDRAKMIGALRWAQQEIEELQAALKQVLSLRHQVQGRAEGVAAPIAETTSPASLPKPKLAVFHRPEPDLTLRDKEDTAGLIADPGEVAFHPERQPDQGSGLSHLWESNSLPVKPEGWHTTSDKYYEVLTNKDLHMSRIDMSTMPADVLGKGHLGYAGVWDRRRGREGSAQQRERSPARGPRFRANR